MTQKPPGHEVVVNVPFDGDFDENVDQLQHKNDCLPFWPTDLCSQQLKVHMIDLFYAIRLAETPEFALTVSQTREADLLKSGRGMTQGQSTWVGCSHLQAKT